MGPLLLCISNSLSNRTQRVLINPSASGIGKLSIGVPQGSVLGPLFFLEYISATTESLLSLPRLFADLEGILNRDVAVISLR